MKAIEREEVIKKVIGYEAFDGTSFANIEQCKAYEESALGVVKKRLKLVTKISQYNLNYDLPDDSDVEIYKIETEDDLKNLNQYIYLETNYKPEEYAWHFGEGSIGKDVMLFWNYDRENSWSYGKGTIEDYLTSIRENYERMVKKEVKEDVQ